MAKLTRAVQKVFASNLADPNEMEQIGSLRNGAQNFTDDPVVLQALPQYLAGMLACASSIKRIPAIEDINGLYFLFTRQLAYLFQEGIPEYDSATTYHINSIVKKSGTIDQYVSSADDNIGNALTDTTKWLLIGSGPGLPLGSYVAVGIGIPGADTDETMLAKGFAKCDGTTPASQGVVSPAIAITMPNLNNGAFIRGNVVSWTAGGASGGADAATLTSAELPSHTHTINQVSTGAYSYDFNHGHSASAGWQSANHTHNGSTGVNLTSHYHNIDLANTLGDGAPYAGRAWTYTGAVDGTSTESQTHTHNLSTGNALADHYHAITVNATGAWSVATAGNHTHSVSADTTGSGTAFSILPTYFSAVYYMRVR